MTPEEVEALKAYNLTRLNTLEDRAREAYIKLMDECWKKLWYFKISSARRTYDEQLMIYTKGRTRATILQDLQRGKISAKEYKDLVKLYDEGKNVYDTAFRTHVISGSTHLSGNAIDIILVGGGSYADIESLGKQFGLSRPLAAPPFLDVGHFEANLAFVEEPKTSPSPESTIKGLTRRLQGANLATQKLIQNAIDLLLRVIERRNNRL